MVIDPTNKDVEQICRTVVSLIQSFHCHVIQDSLYGLIELEAKFRARFVHAFDCLETANEYDYNPNMSSKPDIGEHSRREAVFESKRARYLLVSTANRSICIFILSIVEETWVREF